MSPQVEARLAQHRFLLDDKCVPQNLGCHRMLDIASNETVALLARGHPVQSACHTVHTACRAKLLAFCRFTEADLRLFPTIIRYDSVYAILFKCRCAGQNRVMFALGAVLQELPE